MSILPAAAFNSFLFMAIQAAGIAEGESVGAPWSGQMQCSVTWTDPADTERQWTFSVASDSTNMKLAISDRRRRGDPQVPAKGETRELAPRKARLEIPSVGSSDVEVTSLPFGVDRVWHEITLGHWEKLDELPARFTLALSIGDAPSMSIEMRNFDGARAYLKHCLGR